MSVGIAAFPQVVLGEFLKVRHGRNQREIEVAEGRYPILATGGEIGRTNTPLYSRPSVLIGRKGTIDRPQFREEPFWTVDTLFYTEIAESVADPRYVFYVFQTIDWMSLNEASGVPSLNTRTVEALSIALPDLAEQKLIAAALADADDHIASIERLIAKKQAMRQGVMQELLTGKTRLSGFVGDWTDTRLGQVARIKTGSRNTEDRMPSGEYPFFVRSATVERIDSYSYDCEAILVPGEGGIGSIFHYINGKFEVHQRVYKISDFDPEVSGRFIYYYMRQFFGRHAMENSVKATVDSLRLPTFVSFNLRMPLDRDEQLVIAGTLDDVEREIDCLNRRLRKARSMKQGMMQELLTGRTRLVPLEVSA